MLCAGASELAMSQWASAFAESGLKISKAAGDLAGPCLFAVLMGTSRVLYSRFSEKIPLKKFMALSAAACFGGYLLAALSPHPGPALFGCALCGLSVGIMWPGTFSMAARACPRGGTALFALLALAGDLGCSAGPATVGLAAGAMGGNLKTGLLFGAAFPLLLGVGLLLRRQRSGRLPEQAE